MQTGIDWQTLARFDQTEPIENWRIWLLMGGRGSGKTRSGAEWVRARVATGAARRVALVAPTYTDAREVMLDGESGLLNIGVPSERPHYSPSRRRLEWPCGAVGHIHSAADPDSLRGPQCDTAWADEFCAWDYADETLSNLRFGLRLGQNPKLVVTTTPRPLTSFTKLLDTPGVIITRAATQDNVDLLAPGFLEAMEDSYGGSSLARQELGGELVEDHAGALWTRTILDAARGKTPHNITRIVVAVDPPVTTGVRADSCGIVVAGTFLREGKTHAVVLEDASVQGLSPEGWASRVVSVYHRWQADCVIAEVNQGGELVGSVLRQVDATLPLRTAHARRDKATRAEPVALLYEQGKVIHAGKFPELEDELARLGSSETGKSPDRADALVWAIHALMLGRRGGPNIRRL